MKKKINQNEATLVNFYTLLHETFVSQMFLALQKLNFIFCEPETKHWLCNEKLDIIFHDM